MDCLLLGMSNKEIAKKIGITPFAVKHLLGRMAVKYGIDRKIFLVRVRMVYLYLSNRGL